MWAALLLSALWLQAASRAPARTLTLALLLTAGLAGAAFVAGAFGGRLAVGRLAPLTVALLLGAAVISGALTSWLAALLVLALAGGPGLLLARLLVPSPAPALLVLALGLAALSLAGFAALVAGAPSPWLFVAISAASWAGYLMRGWRWPVLKHAGTPRSESSGCETAMIGLLGALAAMLVLQASVPDCCFDPVWYHLPLVEAIAEHRYRVIPDLWWTMIPLAYHVLAGLAYGLGGGMAAKLLHSVFLFLTASLAVWFGWRLHGLVAGLVAAGLFLTIPVVMWDGTVGNADMGAVFFGVAAVAAFVEFLAGGRPGWLFVTGALVGTATAIKSFAATLLLPIGMILLVERSRPMLRDGFLLLAAGMAVTAGPWLARAAALTGNPVFPAFSESAYAEGLHGGAAWTGAFPWTLSRVLAFPFTLTFRASELAAVPPGAMGSYPLLWLPLLVAGWSGLPRLERYLLAIAGGHLAAVAVFAPSPRFLLSSWLLLAVVLGCVLARSPLLDARHRGVTWRFVPAVLLGALAYSLVSWLGFFPAWPSMDYLTGRIDRHEFLRRTVPALDTFEHLQRLVPPEEKILVDGLYTTWYARRYLLPAWLPPVSPLFRRGNLSRADALAVLREHEIRYFLAPATGRYRLLDLGIATPLLSHEGFTLYVLGGAP